MKINYILMIILGFGMLACGGGKELPPEEIIAGSGSKIWMAQTSYSEDGSQDELSAEELNESMRFNSNGTFAMQSAAEVASGTWSYDPAGPTLKLIFDDENYSENFRVTELRENSMRLEAADGSAMLLVTEK